MRVEFKSFILIKELANNKYFFSLYINKITQKYFASIDTVKCQAKEEKVTCKF